MQRNYGPPDSGYPMHILTAQVRTWSNAFLYGRMSREELARRLREVADKVDGTTQWKPNQPNPNQLRLEGVDIHD